MPAEQIARRSVAFFLIKSSVNFVAVALIGTLMAIGVFGPEKSLWLTAVPGRRRDARDRRRAAGAAARPGRAARAGRGTRAPRDRAARARR